MVRRTLLTLALVLVLGVSPPRADARSDAKEQVEFGIEVALRGLWKEAIYRWERAIDLDPTYAPAWNNLGIAFESEGRFDEAREAYETALDLDPDNYMIEQNYDLFLEVNDRVSQNSR
jgi:Flp pilus assembly protein TadD